MNCALPITKTGQLEFLKRSKFRYFYVISSMLKFFIVKKMSFASYSKSEKKTTQIILFDTFYACVHTKYELYPPLKTYAYKYSYLGIGQSKYI